MYSIIARHVIGAATLTALLFWETLSHLSTQGVFNPDHYEANSERFLMVAPLFLLIWVVRHFKPNHIHESMPVKDKIEKAQKDAIEQSDNVFSLDQAADHRRRA